jgi:signal transduction histidine kinase
MATARGGQSVKYLHGFAVVQEIIRLYGGTISVASTPGEDSTFTVRLPHGDEIHPQ